MQFNFQHHATQQCRCSANIPRTAPLYEHTCHKIGGPRDREPTLGRLSHAHPAHSHQTTTTTKSLVEAHLAKPKIVKEERPKNHQQLRRQTVTEDGDIIPGSPAARPKTAQSIRRDRQPTADRTCSVPVHSASSMRTMRARNTTRSGKRPSANRRSTKTSRRCPSPSSESGSAKTET